MVCKSKRITNVIDCLVLNFDFSQCDYMHRDEGALKSNQEGRERTLHCLLCEMFLSPHFVVI